MPLDGISAKCLAQELNTTLLDARVDRIYQPDRHDILMILRAGRDNHRLILSANPAAPRLHLTHEARENPAEPPMFCMLLRKHLLGARLTRVETPGFERIFIFHFQTTNELGDSLHKKLVVEIMGRHSNIILLNSDNRIHDAILHIDQSVSRLREIMPARTYVEPQNQTKTTPGEAKTMLLQNQSPLLAESLAKPLEKALLESLQGFSPQLCREAIDLAALDPRQRPNQLTPVEQDQLNRALAGLLDRILQGQFAPSTFYLQADDLIPLDFHALSLQSLPYPRLESSLSDAMDRFYLERNRQNKLAQQRQSLARKIEQEIDHTARRLQLHELELQEGERREYYRHCGELLVSQLHLVAEGQSQVNLDNYFDPEVRPIQIELLPQLSANQNAQRYFKLYQKARGKFDTNSRLVIEDRRDLDWLASLLSAANRASDEQDIQAIREEIAATGLSAVERRLIDARSDAGSSASADTGRAAGSNPADFAPGKPGSRARRMARLSQQKSQGKGPGKGGKGRAKDKHTPPPLPPRSYTSSDGFLIQAGRNNIQNDRLTLRTAQKQDIWLHAQKIPGTHVIIRCGNQAVPDRTLEEAAQIAAWFSQVAQRQSGSTGAGAAQPTEKAQAGGPLAKIPVDYCPVSHVRKIAGGRPGLVQYEGYQTLLVEPRLPLSQNSEPSDSIDS